MAHETVSVVVPAYNAEKFIGKTIKALQEQTYKDVEIIIVDDGSSDQTKSIIQTFQRIKYIFQPNAGPASARNRGGQEAQSNILFFTDSDCIPQKDWIEKMMTGFTDESIAVVCGSYGIANPESVLAKCIHKEILYRHHHLVPDYPKVFGSYNFAIRKNVFNQVGGFNTSYRFASGEDNDLSYKIIQAGLKIFFKKDALVDHFHTSRIRKYLREQYRHGFWRAKMYFDFPNMMKGDGYTFWKDAMEVVFALAIPFLILTGLFFKRAWSLSLACILILWLVEIIFAFVTTKNVFESFFYSFVMFCRAFVRAFGLSTGIMRFLPKKNKNMSNSP
jgi:glycosyltransferase involved in cell wall biosynthesis